MTIRDTILSRIVSKLEACPLINQVRQKPILRARELEEIAHTQYPIATVVGGLPIPKGSYSVELGEESTDSAIRSVLSVNIRVFGYNKTTPDAEISSLYDEIHRNLYYDPLLKGYDYTTYNTAALEIDDIVLYAENMPLSTNYFKFYKALKAFPEAALTTMGYTVPADFTDVTSSLSEIAYAISITPNGITEFQDPYFTFQVIYNVEYNHSTQRI